MMKFVISILILGTYVGFINGHSYHLGKCNVVEPVPDFDMSKFLGKWYAVQKTSTGGRCLIYNFTKSTEPNEFKIEQVSEHAVLGLVHDNRYHYTGTLKADSQDVPAKMTVRFPLSVAGSASYVVFMTDYNTYAGIYSCQKLTFANRHSATLLSRTKTLDKVYLDKLRNRLSSWNVSPFDLSVVDQSKCDDSNVSHLNVTSETFSAQNIGKVVRKAGEKVGDGAEYLAKGVGKIYNTVFKNNEHNKKEESENVYLDDTRQVFNPDNDAEWL